MYQRLKGPLLGTLLIPHSHKLAVILAGYLVFLKHNLSLTKRRVRIILNTLSEKLHHRHPIHIVILNQFTQQSLRQLDFLNPYHIVLSAKRLVTMVQAI